MDVTSPCPVSVVICTYNRHASLSRALESIAQSRVPATIRWEVLVVDNNSSDLTKTVVKRYCERFPGRFFYAFEGEQGKSHALNTGIAQARGEVIAFTDDDVEVDSEWLLRIATPLMEGDWAGAGGRILPQSGVELPRWVCADNRYGLAPLAMFDSGTVPGELKEPPFGANMAFRREMFARYGKFRTDLGPQPGGEIKNEDIEFGGRILSAGQRLWYEPSAVVYHSIEDHRVNKSYFLGWWYGKGRSDIRQSYDSDKGIRLLGVPLVFLRRWIIWSVRSFTSFDEVRRFDSQTKAWWLAGTIRESFARFCTGRRGDSDRERSTT